MRVNFTGKIARSPNIKLFRLALGITLTFNFVAFAQADVQVLVSNFSRDEVEALFNDGYRSTEGIPTEWDGDVAKGVAGTLSDRVNEATLKRLNWFRIMSGLPGDVANDPTLSSKAQKAALMMSANRALNHFPPTTWAYYSSEGAEAAAHSNLTLGRSGPEAITVLMEDAGASNIAVGHRRWMLFSRLLRTGIGGIPFTSRGEAALALWVVGSISDGSWGLEGAIPDRPIAWPPPGFVPRQLVFPRWSLSIKNGDFSGAVVVLTRNGVRQNVNIQSLVSGFGDNTIVWETAEKISDLKVSGDLVYDVSVTGVKVNGVSHDYTYQVTSFMPPGGILPVIVGSTVGRGQKNKPMKLNVLTTNSPTGFKYSGAFPRGVKFNAKSAEISGKPKQTGTFKVTISAYNAYGAGKSKKFKLIIK